MVSAVVTTLVYPARILDATPLAFVRRRSKVPFVRIHGIFEQRYGNANECRGGDKQDLVTASHFVASGT